MKRAGAILVIVKRVDGQRDTVNRDRTLGGDKRRDFGRSGDGEVQRSAHILAQCNPADRINMAGDNMSAQFIAQLERLFEIEFAPGAPLVRRGLADSFA